MEIKTYIQKPDEIYRAYQTDVDLYLTVFGKPVHAKPGDYIIVGDHPWKIIQVIKRKIFEREFEPYDVKEE